MKKLIIILAAAAMAGCGIYKPYTRPEEIKTDGLYGQGAETADTTTLGEHGLGGDVHRPLPADNSSSQGLENNTDLQSAHWRDQGGGGDARSRRAWLTCRRSISLRSGRSEQPRLTLGMPRGPTPSP